jgi:peptide deformylase
MRLPLVASDDPVLHKPASPITDLTEVKGIAADMIETMRLEGGVGLAAPQIGKSIRIFVTGVGGTEHVFINPQIEWYSETIVPYEEGCLSLPRLQGVVERPDRVRLQYLSLEGAPQRIEASELLARVIQHEHDHLEGILFPDRMKDIRTLKTLTQEEWDSRFENKE